MRREFPAVPELPEVAELVRRLAQLWADEPTRPRPASRVLEHWDRLINDWSNERSLPLYIRKPGDSRGALIPHRSGRGIVPADNSPAQWAFAQAVVGEQPSLEDVRRLIEHDEIPVALALNASERRGATYRRTLGKATTPNAYGWKVAHVEAVGLATRMPVSEVAEADLRSHFRKLMTPRNMFVIPLRYAGLGELPEFCDSMKAALGRAERSGSVAGPTQFS